MAVRLKPNGRARIFKDLSYPHDTKLGKGQVFSPNEGMSNYEEFEAVMLTSDAKLMRVMCRAGRTAEMVQADWDMV